MTDQKTWEAIWLGIIQGITEFLPISSDGHLCVAHALFRTQSAANPGDDPVELFMVLHLGTLFSILTVYWREVLALIKQPRLCLLIVCATIPVVIIAMPLKDFFDATLQNPLMAGIGFLITAIFLVLAERLETQKYPLQGLKVWQAFVVGLCQTLAPLPGVSRSGTTIGSALVLGMQRPAATTFSFLIAIPAVGGACVLYLKDILENHPHSSGVTPLIIGGLVSYVVGWFCLKWMIRIVNRGKLRWFAVYLLFVGLATIIWQLSVRLSAVPAV